MLRKRLISTASLMPLLFALVALPGPAGADDWQRVASARAGHVYEIKP